MSKSYSEKLKDPRWQKKRLEILQRDNFTCVECGNSKNTLHVHHLYYDKNPWDVKSNRLVTLCEYCHDEIHSHSLTDVGNNGFLDCFDLIKEKPVFYTKYLSEIINHKGIWELHLRDHQKIEGYFMIIYNLKLFIKEIDCQINVIINGHCIPIIE